MTVNERQGLLSAGYDAHGAYGPTIVLQLDSLDAVKWLRQMFFDVAEGRRSIQLQEFPEVRIVDFESLELTIATSDAERQLVRLGDKAVFVWKCSPDKWRANAELLDPFMNGREGHQYLTSEKADDAVIEVSFGERHPGL